MAKFEFNYTHLHRGEIIFNNKVFDEVYICYFSPNFTNPDDVSYTDYFMSPTKSIVYKIKYNVKNDSYTATNITPNQSGVNKGLYRLITSINGLDVEYDYFDLQTLIANMELHKNGFVFK